MSGFLRSIPGRLAAAACATALGGGGIAALSGPGTSLYVMAIATLVAVALGIVSMQLAVGEPENPFAWHTTLGLCVLPFVLWLFAMGLLIAMKAAPWIGWVLLPLGVGSAGLALRGGGGGAEHGRGGALAGASQ